MSACPLHPPFSLFGCAKKRKRAVHGPKEKNRLPQELLPFFTKVSGPPRGAGGGFGARGMDVRLTRLAAYPGGPVRTAFTAFSFRAHRAGGGKKGEPIRQPPEYMEET